MSSYLYKDFGRAASGGVSSFDTTTKKNKLMASNKRLHHLYVYCTTQQPTVRRDVCT